MNSSSSPSGSQCENSDSFCYQNNSSNNNNIINNNNAHLNNKNLENSAHKGYSEVNSRENSPRENYRVDSPEKRLETCTPDETSRSFSSHRNDGSPSPIHHHSDSVDSQSPENLTSKSQSQSNKNPSVNDMLDHKLQLSFLGPPLAALHSMTEMKSQNSPKATQNSQCVTNPHGIDSILSRPTPVTSAHLNAALGGELISHKISSK